MDPGLVQSWFQGCWSDQSTNSIEATTIPRTPSQSTREQGRQIALLFYFHHSYFPASGFRTSTTYLLTLSVLLLFCTLLSLSGRDGCHVERALNAEVHPGRAPLLWG